MPASTPRHRLAVPALGTLAAALLLTACGPAAAPAADPHDPVRPTEEGSISEAVRRTTPRRASRTSMIPGRAEAPDTRAEPAPPPPDASAALDTETRDLVLAYIESVQSVTESIRAMRSTADADRVASEIAPHIDRWRACMDTLAMAPQWTREQIRDVFARPLVDTNAEFRQARTRVGNHESTQRIANMLADVPLLD
ncbi:MAG: hypothetical protein R3B68_11200 [Phycisphaerales bacterium]